MKKTLTANISGTVFHIEEDAYEALHRYLGNIRGRFEGTEGRDEIMADIEARIAELFTERLDGRGQVVTLADVEHVIGIMGQPEDYMDDDSESAPPPPGGTAHRRHRRLFRDADDRWVGGVLSGLAAYIGTDPLWLRVAFILFIALGAGSPILIYIILWILIPTANTPAERLMMEGEPVTVDNLKRAFEQGAQRVAADVEDLGKRWEGSAPRYASSFRSGARRAAGAASNVFRKLVGAVLVAIGISLGISLLGAAIGGSIFTLDSIGDHTTLLDVAGITFATQSQAIWFAIASLLLLAIPVIGLLSVGFQLLLSLRAPRWLGWTLTIVWVASLVVATFIGIRLANDLKRSEPLRTEQVLERPAGNVLHLRAAEGSTPGRQWSISYRHGRVHQDLDGIAIGEDSVHGGWACVDVRRSPDDQFRLVTERRSQGRTATASLRRSDNIRHVAHQADSSLYISPWLSWPREDKFRGQRMRIVVLVPEGGAVHFHRDMGFLLDDVRNVTRTLDRDMVGHTWTMTPEGLSRHARPGKPEETGAAEPAKETEAATPLRTRRRDVQASSSRGFIMPDLFALLRPRL